LKGFWQVIEKTGAGDGTRTHDVQLGKMAVTGEEFLRRFLLHVLPRGFVRESPLFLLILNNIYSNYAFNSFFP